MARDAITTTTGAKISGFEQVTGTHVPPLVDGTRKILLDVILRDSSGREGGESPGNFNTRDGFDVSSGATDNHDFLVPAGKVFLLEAVYSWASGPFKAVIQHNESGSFSVRAVRGNTAGNVPDYVPGRGELISAGRTIRVSRVNMNLVGAPAFEIVTTIVGKLFDV